MECNLAGSVEVVPSGHGGEVEVGIMKGGTVTIGNKAEAVKNTAVKLV